MEPGRSNFQSSKSFLRHFFQKVTTFWKSIDNSVNNKTTIKYMYSKQLN